MSLLCAEDQDRRYRRRRIQDARVERSFDVAVAGAVGVEARMDTGQVLALDVERRDDEHLPMQVSSVSARTAVLLVVQFKKSVHNSVA